MAENIKLGTYTPPEITEESGNKQEIIASFFFDGTLNSLRNTYIRKEKEKKKAGKNYDKDAVADDPWGVDKDSYENDYSNVARKYQMCLETYSFYIEGIGTEDGETDTVRGYTTGTGGTGIRAKIRKGCEKLAEKVKNNVELDLIIDVFGFSRGAAAARAFVHEITRGKYTATPIYARDEVFYVDLDGHNVDEKDLPARGHLGLLIKQKNTTIKLFKIRFVGLYDTVSSYGVNFEDDTTDKDDIKEINLKSISHTSVKKVVQIAAGHEWRTNFNLTDIGSAGQKGLQLTFPGAHADVGGCYETTEEKITHYVKASHEDGMEISRNGTASKKVDPIKEKYKQDLVDQGWYEKEQLTFQLHSSYDSLYYIGKRKVDNRYSYIPLHFMCNYCMETGTKIKTAKLEKNFIIPKTSGTSQHILDYVHSKLKEYAKHVEEGGTKSYKSFLDFANEKILINGFVHWSATNKTGHSPRENKKRKVIPG
jgi:hypothetical protein